MSISYSGPRFYGTYLGFVKCGLSNESFLGDARKSLSSLIGCQVQHLWGEGYREKKQKFIFSPGNLPYPVEGIFYRIAPTHLLGNRKGGGYHPLCYRTTCVIRTVGDTFAYFPSPFGDYFGGGYHPLAVIKQLEFLFLVEV